MSIKLHTSKYSSSLTTLNGLPHILLSSNFVLPGSAFDRLFSRQRKPRLINMSDTEDSQSFHSVRSRASREELSMTAHILATMEENGYIEAGTTDLLRAVSK